MNSLGLLTTPAEELLTESLLLALDPAEFARRRLEFEPDESQEEILRSPARRILLNASRQFGKSSLAGILALHRAVYDPGCLVLILSRAQRQSAELFKKVMRFRQILGEPLEQDSALSLQLRNGSRIVSLPGSEETVRGFSGVSLLIIDEAARVPDELYHAVRPMLAVSGGDLLALSTPFGRLGWFYESWIGESGSDVEPWERFRVTAGECSRISPEFLAEERAVLPAWFYRQEYNCCFEDTEDQIFGSQYIAAAFTGEAQPLWPAAAQG